MTSARPVLIRLICLLVVAFVATLAPGAHATTARASGPVIRIGSKAFTEGYVLAELLAQKLEHDLHAKVERRLGMGATGVLFTALQAGEIDLYTEYTGTISEAILKRPGLKDFDDIQRGLEPLGLVMSPPLGFNNTYALAVPRAFAEQNHLRTISDLRPLTGRLRAGFSHEFMARADGFRALTARYGLRFPKGLQSMEHSLAYRAVASGAVDLIDVYSTDAKIEKLGLTVLRDDLGFFPDYSAVILARRDFIERSPAAWRALLELKGTLTAETMRRLNAEVDNDKMSFRAAAAGQLGWTSGPTSRRFNADRLLQRTREHLFLVALSLLFSVVVGIPLGVFATGHRLLGQSILLLSGVVQTVPSLALLCFLVPLFGIGTGSALVALCLYGLLPVVMNTYIGLRSIDSGLLDMADALGLTRRQILMRIKLPLASRSILGGIKTSAVIGIGTATLAALIGAGGYGATILAGLAINDTGTILLGAAPAAAMALGVHLLFEVLTSWLIPRGLR
jgi:osmoprotectant transport system permease protein